MKATIFLFFIVLAVITITAQSFYREENLREEIDSLRSQIREKFDAGQLDEARELQDLLRDKITRRYGDGGNLDADYDTMIQERIKAHQDARRQSSKVRYSSASSTSKRASKNSKNGGGNSKFSDSRALHQMDQTHRKAEILRNKINRGSMIFTSEEIENFNQRIQQYIEAEEKVAHSLQATSDDYNKARSMRDKESRLKHLEGAKQRKQKRHEDEYQMREVSRKIFFGLNDELDSRLDAYEKQQSQSSGEL